MAYINGNEIAFGANMIIGGGGSGENGATFIPSVSSAGVLSWSNDKGLTNPSPVNIKGEKGEQGIQGAKGDKGDKGDTGSKGADGKTPIRGVDYFTEADKSAIVTAVLEAIGTPLFGLVDENNNVILSGKLDDGTYTIKYEMADSTVPIGELVLDTAIYYSITNSLTNCSNGNTETKVVEGKSYSATITANSGYALSSVKVTMGGVDITSSVVSGGNINIVNVTGDVVITATATLDKVSVSNNLTNCVNSNTAISVDKGSNYSATITANDGYELKSLTVTMGGSPVTVTNGVINIASVTGNIVITAVAEAVSNNALEKAINADGTPFVGTNGEKGYKTGVRISGSSGGESTQAGCMATGFISAQSGQYVVIEGAILSNTASHNVLVLYDENFAKVINTQIVAGNAGISSPSSGVYRIRINSFTGCEKVRYIRFSCADLSNAKITYENE